MKQNVRRALAISGIAVVIGTTGLAYNASAKIQTKTEKVSHKKELSAKKALSDKKTGTKIHRRTIPGVVSSVSDNSLEIKSGNKTYAVELSSTTRILNLKWNKISLGDIKNGDKIRVFGTVSSNKITAQTVRDISLGKTERNSSATTEGGTAK